MTAPTEITRSPWRRLVPFRVCVCVCVHVHTVDMDIFTVILFSLYSQLVNNREIKLTLIIQRQLQYYSISAAIVKIKYA